MCGREFRPYDVGNSNAPNTVPAAAAMDFKVTRRVCSDFFSSEHSGCGFLAEILGSVISFWPFELSTRMDKKKVFLLLTIAWLHKRRRSRRRLCVHKINQERGTYGEYLLFFPLGHYHGSVGVIFVALVIKASSFLDGVNQGIGIHCSCGRKATNNNRKH